MFGGSAPQEGVQVVQRPWGSTVPAAGTARRPLWLEQNQGQREEGTKPVCRACGQREDLDFFPVGGGSPQGCGQRRGGT